MSIESVGDHQMSKPIKPALVDVPVNYGWDSGTFSLLSVVLGVYAVQFPLLSTMSIPAYVHFFMFVFMAVGVIWIRMGYKAHRTQQILRQAIHQQDDLQEAVAGILSKFSNVSTDNQAYRPGKNTLAAIGRTLYENGERGRVWVFRTEKEAVDEVSPFELPFEPTLLNEQSQALHELAGRQISESQSLLISFKLQMAQFSQSFGGRVAGWIMAKLMLLGVLYSIIQLLRTFFSGQFSQSREMLMGAAGIIVLSMVVKFWHTSQWYVVPSAIVVRNSFWWRSAWDLDVMPREKSLLLYWRRANQLVVVGPEGRCYSRTAWPVEAECALRAFLSPLPAPGRDELTDLQ